MTTILRASSSQFVDTPAIDRIVQRALRYLQSGFAVHLRGPAGTGKTTLALHLANLLSRPIAVVFGDDEFKTSDLIGNQSGYSRKKVVDNFIHNVVKVEDELKLSWVDSRLTVACKEGFTLVYDEFNRSRPEVNNVLLSALEEKILALPVGNSNNEYLQVHPEFRVIFTSNPEEYCGVHSTQDALLDRMVTIDIPEPDELSQLEILTKKTEINRLAALAIVRLVKAFRVQTGNDKSSGLRAGLILASICQDYKIPANPSCDDFREICGDVLISRAGLPSAEASILLRELLNSPENFGLSEFEPLDTFAQDAFAQDTVTQNAVTQNAVAQNAVAQNTAQESATVVEDNSTTIATLDRTQTDETEQIIEAEELQAESAIAELEITLATEIEDETEVAAALETDSGLAIAREPEVSTETENLLGEAIATENQDETVQDETVRDETIQDETIADNNIVENNIVTVGEIEAADQVAIEAKSNDEVNLETDGEEDETGFGIFADSTFLLQDAIEQQTDPFQNSTELEASPEQLSTQLQEPTLSPSDEILTTLADFALELDAVEVAPTEATQVEATQVEAEQIEVEQIEVEQIEVEQIEVEQIEVEQIEVEQIEVEQIEVEQIEVEQIEAEDRSTETESLEDFAASFGNTDSSSNTDLFSDIDSVSNTDPFSDPDLLSNSDPFKLEQDDAMISLEDFADTIGAATDVDRSPEPLPVPPTTELSPEVAIPDLASKYIDHSTPEVKPCPTSPSENRQTSSTEEEPLQHKQEEVVFNTVKQLTHTEASLILQEAKPDRPSMPKNDRPDKQRPSSSQVKVIEAPEAESAQQSAQLVEMLQPARKETSRESKSRDRRAKTRTISAPSPTTAEASIEAQTIEPQAIEPQAIEPQAIEPQAIEPQPEAAIEPQPKATIDLQSGNVFETLTALLAADASPHQQPSRPTPSPTPVEQPGIGMALDRQILAYLQTTQGARLVEIERALGIRRAQLIAALKTLMSQGRVVQRGRLYQCKS